MKQAEFDRLYNLGACSGKGSAMEWLRNNHRKSAAALWLKCQRPDWMLWLLWRLDIPRALRIKITVRLVRDTPLHDGRTVNDLLTDERSRNVLVVAERFADGEATEDEMNQAIAAADAADAAADAAAADAAAVADVAADVAAVAADAAARAAVADVAADAADAAAAAADAAVAAADAADAVFAAARAATDAAVADVAAARAADAADAADAVFAAARAAADAADAVFAAARAAADAAQCDIIRSFFPVWDDVLKILPGN